MAAETGSGGDRFHVPGWLDVLGYMVEHWPEAWRRLGDAETRRIRDRLAGLEITAPVYVTGLARAGSTVLLELLSSHPGVATHRYRDFPMVHIPWFWNRFVDSAGTGTGRPHERAHGDGIEVTAESPEAFEEVLWMSFFPDAHDPSVSSVLDRDVAHPEFEAFYRDHIRKLMLMRGGQRYLAKGNYNVTRLGYLRRLFPDARFVVPVRDPVGHVASLMRQHTLFCRVGRERPRVRRRMRRAGHFEFGLDLRPINTGDPRAMSRIQQLWAAGDDVEAWARYWAMVYGHVADVVEADRAVRDGTLVVRFEDLCRAPADVMHKVLRHTGLPSDSIPRQAAKRIHAPRYYRLPFSDAEQRLIRRVTEETASRFGYGVAFGGCVVGAA